MTISSTTNRAQFNCNGSTTSFPFTFKYVEASDLQVYLHNTVTGATTLLTLNVDYEITPAIPGPGGTLDFLGTYLATPPGSDYVLTILRFILRTQEVDFINGDSLDENNIEGMGDKLTMMVQDLDERIGRAVTVPPSSALTGIRLPIPAAGKLIRWKATLDGFENVAVADIGSQVINNFWAVVLAAAGSSLAEALATMGLAGALETFALPANTTISAFIKTLLDDADAATARATLNAGTSGIFLTGDQGTVGIFGQNTAPSGWTIDTNHADCVLALKGGSGKYNANGGTTAGSWSHLHATQGHALTTDQMPSHYHTVTVQGNTANNTPTYISGGSTSVTTAYFNTSSAGSGASHNHGDVTGAKELTGDSPGSWRPLASLCIRAIKN